MQEFQEGWGLGMRLVNINVPADVGTSPLDTQCIKFAKQQAQLMLPWECSGLSSGVLDWTGQCMQASRFLLLAVRKSEQQKAGWGMGMRLNYHHMKSVKLNIMGVWE